MDHLPVRQGKSDLVIKDIGVDITVTMGVANITPIPFDATAPQIDPYLHQGWKKVFGKIVVGLLWDILQDLRFQDIDTRIDRIAEHLAPARFFQEFFDSSTAVGDNNPKIQRILHRGKGNAQFCLFFVMVINNCIKVEIGHQIAADNNKVFVLEVLFRIFDRTGSTVIVIGDNIVDSHAQFFAVLKIIPDHVGHKVKQYHKLFDTYRLEASDNVLHHRFVDNRQHRLGHRVCQRLDSGSESSCHYDGFHLLPPGNFSFRICLPSSTPGWS